MSGQRRPAAYQVEAVRHILITRYNISFRPAARAGVDALSADWLDYRDRLFKAYCVPSVEAQENRDFEWLVLFHPQTPARYYEFLGGIATVVLASDLRSAKKKISRRRFFRRPTLTTRLDNDDCIAIDFTAKIRAAAEKAVSNKFGHSTDFVVVPPVGAHMDIATKRWQLRESKSPPFISIFEGTRMFRRWRTPLEFNHTTILEYYPFVMVEDEKPVWMRMLHDRNLSTRKPDPQPDRDLGELLDRFPALRALVPKSGGA